MSTPKEIAQFITEKAQTSDELLGSSIGYELKENFPQLDIKKQFGGLKRFIQDYCSDQIEFVAKRGLDDVYISKSRVVNQERDKAVSLYRMEATTETDLWKAFSNPNYQSVIAINKGTGDMLVVAPDAELQAELTPVPKVTDEEHRAIARGFVPQSNVYIRQKLASVLDHQHYWNEWNKVINAQRDGTYRTWIEWRGQQILNLFQRRLESAHLPDELIKAFVRRMSTKLYRNKSTSASLGEHTSPTDVSPSLAHLRELVHAAVDLMSEEELRQIKIPVGVVVDVTGKQRH
jgi:hypothetical protein